MFLTPERIPLIVAALLLVNGLILWAFLRRSRTWKDRRGAATKTGSEWLGFVRVIIVGMGILLIVMLLSALGMFVAGHFMTA